MITYKDNNLFQIKIDYESGREQPSLIFKTMYDVIESFQYVDKCVINIFPTKIESNYLLKNIEVGSIKTIISTVLKSIDDDALKNLEWKKIIGSFLVKAKHKILEKIDNKEEFTDINQVKELSNDILILAENTGILTFPTYTSIPQKLLLNSILRLNSSIKYLNPEEQVYLISDEGEVKINKSFIISEEIIEDLLTKETQTFTIELILRIKKPDYIGTSMWDVQCNNKIIPVKIIDYEWLNKFQNRKIDVLPGDSIRAIVETTYFYGYDYSLVNEHYVVTNIIEVIKEYERKEYKQIDITNL